MRDTFIMGLLSDNKSVSPYDIHVYKGTLLWEYLSKVISLFTLFMMKDDVGCFQ